MHSTSLPESKIRFFFPRTRLTSSWSPSRR